MTSAAEKQKICSADDCDRSTERGWRGYCIVHYQRLRRGTDMNAPVRVRSVREAPCVIEGCGRLHWAKQLCHAHYQRLRRFGDPLVDTPVVARATGVHGELTCHSMHVRLRKLWGRAAEHPCVKCSRQAQDWAYDGTDPSELYGASDPGVSKRRSRSRYSRYPEFYMPLCKKCHLSADRAIAARELEQYRTLLIETGLTFEQIRDILSRFINPEKK